jgi:hypothetical protein
MRWTRCVARTGEIGNAYNIFVGKREGYRDHSEDTAVDGWIITEQMLKKMGCEGVKFIHVAQDRDQ